MTSEEKYKTNRITGMTLIYVLFISSFLLPTIGIITRGRTFIVLLSYIIIIIYMNKYMSDNRSNSIQINSKKIYVGLSIFTVQVTVQYILNIGIGYQNILTLIFYIFITVFSYEILKKYFPVSLQTSVRLTYFLFSISLIFSIIYMANNYAIVKIITGNYNTGDSQYIKANLWGVGNSIYYMALTASYPLIIDNFISKKYYVNKLIDFLVFITVPIAIVLSGSITAIAMLVLGLMIYLFINIMTKNFIKGFNIIIITMLLLTIIYFIVYLNNNSIFINWIEKRIISFTTSFFNNNITDESYIYRQYLNRISLNSFYNNPLFGIGTHIGDITVRIRDQEFGNGNHAAFYDLLGQYGILGTISFVIIYLGILKQSLRIKSKDNHNNNISVFSGFIIIIVSSIYNPTILNGMYFTIIYFFFVLCNFQRDNQS